MTPGAGRHLLLVEDNPIHARLLTTHLARHDVSVHWARNGEQAITYLSNKAPDQQPHRLALILLDLKMPGLSGFEVLDHLKSDPALRSIPAVVLTTSGEYEDVRLAYRKGANGYLVKPTDWKDLERVIASVVDFWLVHNHVPV
jgi:CheY-like chemotaxis protein